MLDITSSKTDKRSSFEVFWTRITDNLSSPQTIINWTIDKGITGEDFVANLVGATTIVVSPPSAQNTPRVSKADFKLIYDNWQSYLERKVRRGELMKQSRFTKYTISIIHQYQDLI